MNFIRAQLLRLNRMRVSLLAIGLGLGMYALAIDADTFRVRGPFVGLFLFLQPILAGLLGQSQHGIPLADLFLTIGLMMVIIDGLATRLDRYSHTRLAAILIGRRLKFGRFRFNGTYDSYEEAAPVNPTIDQELNEVVEAASRMTLRERLRRIRDLLIEQRNIKRDGPVSRAAPTTEDAPGHFLPRPASTESEFDEPHENKKS